MSVWVLIPVVVCAMSVLCFVIGVGSEFAVSDATVTDVIGPGEGECLLVCGV